MISPIAERHPARSAGQRARSGFSGPASGFVSPPDPLVVFPVGSGAMASTTVVGLSSPPQPAAKPTATIASSDAPLDRMSRPGLS
jgi:hypothetical protein